MNEIKISTKPTLDALVRAALSESSNPDPASVIDGVVDGIDESDYRYYLSQAISYRLSTLASPRKNLIFPVARQGVSTKQSLIRDEYWPKFLRQRISLPTGYKFLSDATAADLRVVAEHRFAQAVELRMRGEQFMNLAKLMEQSQVVRVAELDPSMGLKVLVAA